MHAARGRTPAISKHAALVLRGDWTVITWKDISALTPFLHLLHIKPQGALS